MARVHRVCTMCMRVCVFVYMFMYAHVHKCVSGDQRSIFHAIPQVLKM